MQQRPMLRQQFTKEESNSPIPDNVIAIPATGKRTGTIMEPASSFRFSIPAFTFGKSKRNQ